MFFVKHFKILPLSLLISPTRENVEIEFFISFLFYTSYSIVSQFHRSHETEQFDDIVLHPIAEESAGFPYYYYYSKQIIKFGLII